MTAGPPIPEGSRRCANPLCGRVKPLAEFLKRDPSRPPYPRCRGCRRRDLALRRRTEAYRLWQQSYAKRPDVIGRKRGYYEADVEGYHARQAEYRRTPRGKLAAAIRRARHDIRAGCAPDRVRALQARIAACSREIARMDKAEGREPRGRPIATDPAPRSCHVG